VQHNVPYGSAGGQQLLMNVYTPPTGEQPRPAVLTLHAGGFYTGSKDDPDIVRASYVLAIAGFEVFDIDYRLAPQSPFPAAVHDAQSAVGFVRQNAERYGVDPTRIGIAGASAGATIAAWVACVGKGALTADDRVAAAVGWSGPMDFPALVNELSPSDRRVSPESPAAGYLQGPDLEQEAVQASPITYVDPTDPPMLLTVGAREQTPIQQPELMQAALRKAGVPVVLRVIPGSNHALYGGNFKPAILAAVLFLTRELHGPLFQQFQIRFPPVLGYHRLPRIALWVVVLLLLLLAVIELVRGWASKAR
jgi:acetyl esterase/lipase